MSITSRYVEESVISRHKEGIVRKLSVALEGKTPTVEEFYLELGKVIDETSFSKETIESFFEENYIGITCEWVISDVQAIRSFLFNQTKDSVYANYDQNDLLDSLGKELFYIN